MKSRFVQWLFAALLPLTGTAQSLPSLAPVPPQGKTPLVDELLALDASQPALAQGAPVVPIWSGPDGKLLAVVALPREWGQGPLDPTPGYAGPSDWHLADTIAAASGFSWQIGSGFRADAMLGQYRAQADATCTSANCSIPLAPWARNSITGAIGLGWTAGDGALDLSYGLSWLQSQPARPVVGELSPGIGGGAVPVLALPGAFGAHGLGLDSETSLFARGRWHFDRNSSFDLTASYGRGRLTPFAQAGAPGIDLDQLSLSLGLGVGSLRGAVVGHVVRSDDPLFAGKRWTTLDLGVSWRTPWSGELSVGAQNLLNAPLAVPRDAEGQQQSRTPYIQYRQDL